MLAALTDFDQTTSVGILSRLAFAIEDEFNPACQPRLPNELFIRKQIWDEALSRRGYDKTRLTAVQRSLITDLLDQESDSLIGKTDPLVAFARLSNKGYLPSDLFRIHIIPQIQQFHGRKFHAERNRIEETVRFPDKEQHYGESDDKDEPSLVSIFVKFFEDKFTHRSFLLLVAGQRSGVDLDVHQAWRIYPDLIQVESVTTPVEMLERFAEKFGVDVSVGSKTGKFIISADIPKGKNVETVVEIKPPEKSPTWGKGAAPKSNVAITSFIQHNPKGEEKNQLAMIVAIDLLKYEQTLRSRGW
jgi:hypothetical protein